MDISFGDIGIKNGMVGANAADAVDAGRAAAGKSDVAASNANLTVGKRVDALSSGEPVAEVPQSALSRDDKLGALVNAAFSMPPPAMPDFS